MDLTAKSFRPEPVRNSREARDYLPVETLNNVFELMHKPLDWEAKDGRWLPNLSPIFFLSGVNNYDDMGVKDPEAVRTIYRRKGCACIVPDDARLGPYMHYIATVPAINPKFNSYGKYYLTIFESPEMVAGQVVWRRDEEAYDAFRLHLVTSGICVMNATIANLVINQKKSQLSTMEQVPINTASKKARIVSLQTTIKDMLTLIKTGNLSGPVAAKVKFKIDREVITHDAAKE